MSTLKLSLPLAALAAALTLSSPAAARDDKPNQREDRSRSEWKSDPDRFKGEKGEANRQLEEDLQRLHADNRAEVIFGEQAIRQARDPLVRELARSIVRDHRQMDQDLKRVARQRGIDLEGDVYEKELEAARKANEPLNEKKGEEFDRLYSERMEKEHHEHLTKKLPDMIDNAREAGEDRIVALLERAKTKLEKHHEAAQRASDSTGSGSETRTGVESRDRDRFRDDEDRENR